MLPILDLHNYGRFNQDGTELLLGSEQLPYSALANVWQRIIDAMADRNYAVALMNEPRDLPNPTQATPAAEWEIGSNAVVNDLRTAGYTGQLIVGGYEWSKLQKWTQNHDDAWINDPHNNTIYEAHHYWDEGSRGIYE